ncbi:MAG: bifunctional diguanylate cyclase/phosphodiesterase [Gammaproteobacteria bacterium]|nr:bifunctional diguanylate cyclase/phosphodiesterase [Gammaproteobacteria bacterium]
MTVDINTECSKPNQNKKLLVVGGRCSSENHMIEFLTKLVAADLKYTYTQGLYHSLSHKSDISFDVILVDISEGNGIDSRDLSILADTYHHCAIIAIDKTHNDETANSATRHGATKYLVHTTANKDQISILLEETYQQNLAARQLAESSRYDDLTGLANETALRLVLETSLEHVDFDQVSMTLLSISIDTGKQNASVDKKILSCLLPAISRRLEHNLRATDMVSRGKKSGFNILLRHLNAESDSAIVAEKLIETLQSPYNIDERIISISCNIGMALPSVRHCNGQQLIEDADNALTCAQKLGGNHFSYHTLRARPAESLNLRSRLNEALSQNQFRLVYQPQVDIKNNHVVAIEALLRWQLTPDNLLAPAQFMHHIEQSRHCTKVAHWVIDNVCQQISQWHFADQDKLPISINLSQKQFIDPSLVNTLENALLKYGTNPKQIRLEVNEITLRQNIKHSKETLQQLKQLGIQVSIDDFGTGARTLDTLHSFNVGQVKIDSSLIGSALDTPTSMEIVDSLIISCHQLGINIAAEAVETQDQLHYLQQKNCDSYQGYLFSKPVTANALPELLLFA